MKACSPYSTAPRPDGTPVGGPISSSSPGLGRRWRPLAVTFAIAGMFGTLLHHQRQPACRSARTAASSAGLSDDSPAIRLSLGILMALIVGSVVIGGIRRIASVATVLVPFMVTTYFIMVASHRGLRHRGSSGVFASIFSEAFSLRAGWGSTGRSGHNRSAPRSPRQRRRSRHRLHHARHVG